MSKKEFDGVCPCCNGHMQVTEYRCKKCGITISGDFQKSNFWNLDALQLKFAEIFLKNRGNIKDVEKELGVSYPSVKKLLDNLVSSLTGGSKPSVTPKVVISHREGLFEIKDDTAAEAADEEETRE